MKQLAQAASISYSYVRSMEAGIKNPPAAEVLHRISRVLRVTVDELLADDATAQMEREMREAKEAYEAGIAAQERIASLSGSSAASLRADAKLTAKGRVLPGPQTLLDKFDNPRVLAALSGAGITDEEIDGLREALRRVPAS